MCKKEDNWCQKEKRGCEGCHYEEKKKKIEKLQEENYNHIPRIN